MAPQLSLAPANKIAAANLCYLHSGEEKKEKNTSISWQATEMKKRGDEQDNWLWKGLLMTGHRWSEITQG